MLMQSASLTPRVLQPNYRKKVMVEKHELANSLQCQR